MKSFFASLSVALLLAISPASATNLVVNGNFSNGFDGWTLSGNTGFTGTATNYAFLGPVGSDGYMTQLVPTVAGKTYDFSYSLKNLGGTPNDFTSSIDSTPKSTLVNVDAFDFTTYMYSFVANGSTPISFAFRQDPSFFYLTNVSVSSVPLPAALPLFSGALAAFGLRRRAKAA